MMQQPQLVLVVLMLKALMTLWQPLLLLVLYPLLMMMLVDVLSSFEAVEFDDLLTRIGARITYQDTNYRRSIPAEERLSICLRFLATGDSYRTIAGSFRAGISTVSMLIPDVVAAIWDCLVEEFMAVPGAEEWR
uniref:Transposase Helix-turn-helix domain-containing protein n=1 Tax=Knipowitschia caucasica TaxID=637954 RepID=A0AAV2LWN7_KNICA